jgi:hypothetical protein
MKKLFLTLAATAMLLIPAAAMAQSTIARTMYEGESITGVEASSGFEVVLVKSNRTKAVFEVDREIEPYMRISRDGSGVVSVGRRNLSYSENREINKIMNRNRERKIVRVTLHVPSIETIRLSSSASLGSADAFSGDDLDIMTSSSASVREGLKMSYRRVKIQSSSSSNVDHIVLDATTDLAVVASSSARVAIVAPRLDYSKLGVSSMATVSIAGAGVKGGWSVSSSGRVVATDFTVHDLNLSVSSGGSANVHVMAGGRDLSVSASSSGRATITADEVGMARFSSSSGGSISVSGTGKVGDWDAGSGGRIAGDEFELRDLNVTASSGASVRANVSGTLTTRTSSGASVRYAGNPARINNLSSSVQPIQ